MIIYFQCRGMLVLFHLYTMLTFICDVIVLINVYNYSFVNISSKVLKILICFQCSFIGSS